MNLYYILLALLEMIQMRDIESIMTTNIAASIHIITRIFAFVDVVTGFCERLFTKHNSEQILVN